MNVEISRKLAKAFNEYPLDIATMLDWGIESISADSVNELSQELQNYLDNPKHYASQVAKHLAGKHDQSSHAGGHGHKQSDIVPAWDNAKQEEARDKYWAYMDELNKDPRWFSVGQYEFRESPEGKALLRKRDELFSAVWGPDSEENKWRNEVFSATDSEGNPIKDGDYHNAYQLADGMSTARFDEKQLKVRDWYVGDETGQTLVMNAKLRAGESHPKAAQTARLVESRTLKKPIMVYRGIAMTPQQVAGLKVGDSKLDRAFQSTSVSRDTANFYLGVRMKQGLGSVPVMFRQVISAGSHAISMDSDEIVVNRNSRVTVTGISHENDGTVVVDTVVTHD